METKHTEKFNAIMERGKPAKKEKAMKIFKKVSELNKEILPLSRGWSEAMITTIRAGAISRLNELGLINRLRRGVDVTYSLTQYGKEILDTYSLKQGGS